jgi:tyrosine-protein phosphatase SIW14
MKTISDSRFLPPRFALALALTVCVSPCFAQTPSVSAPDSAVAAPAPEYIAAPHGISNFAEVSPTLFRGAQPSKESYAELKKLGISTIVSFRDEQDNNAREQAAVEAQGMRFVSIPWNAHINPTDVQMAAFFQVLREHPDQKIYVHCARGADRTGVMVAAYRVALENWTPDKALQEMYEHHFWVHVFPNLKAYVMNLPKLFSADSTLRAVLAVAPVAAEQQ